MANSSEQTIRLETTNPFGDSPRVTVSLTKKGEVEAVAVSRHDRRTATSMASSPFAAGTGSSDFVTPDKDCIPEMEIPPELENTPGKEVDVHICEVFDPGHFYVQLNGEATTGELERVMSDMDQTYRTPQRARMIIK